MAPRTLLALTAALAATASTAATSTTAGPRQLLCGATLNGVGGDLGSVLEKKTGVVRPVSASFFGGVGGESARDGDNRRACIRRVGCERACEAGRRARAGTAYTVNSVAGARARARELAESASAREKGRPAWPLRPYAQAVSPPAWLGQDYRVHLGVAERGASGGKGRLLGGGRPGRKGGAVPRRVCAPDFFFFRVRPAGRGPRAACHPPRPRPTRPSRALDRLPRPERGDQTERSALRGRARKLGGRSLLPNPSDRPPILPLAIFRPCAVPRPGPPACVGSSGPAGPGPGWTGPRARSMSAALPRRAATWARRSDDRPATRPARDARSQRRERTAASAPERELERRGVQ